MSNAGVEVGRMKREEKLSVICIEVVVQGKGGYFEPVKRVQNGSDVTGFGSFDNSIMPCQNILHYCIASVICICIIVNLAFVIFSLRATRLISLNPNLTSHRA